jgi:hypothetical protein
MDNRVARLARRKQNFEVGPHGARLGADLGSGEAAGQDDIRKQQIGPQLPFQNPQSRLAIVHFEHTISNRAEGTDSDLRRHDTSRAPRCSMSTVT